MKPRVSYRETFPALDFEHMAIGTALDLEGKRVTLQGWHHGHIWIGHMNRTYFLRRSDPLIDKLKAAEQ